MFDRHARTRLLRLARGFPVVVLTGPRQSGKTTLARAACPDHACVSLEDPDVRERAAADPRGLLGRHRDGLLIDELQRMPALLSYVQTAVDAGAGMGRVVLTGSQNLLPSAAVSQCLAGRAGQMLNLNAVANDLGIAQTTARDWLAVLGASSITFRPPPVHGNLGKRLVKTPKLYFVDTGVAAWLLGITRAAALADHPMRGALFENMLVAEYLKYLRHHGLAHGMHLWRDNTGNEIDLLIGRAGALWPVEMKSGATFQREWLRGLHTWARHAAAARQGHPLLIGAAPGHFGQEGVAAVNWRLALGGLVAADDEG